MKKMTVYLMLVLGVVVSGGSALATSIMPVWVDHNIPVGSVWESEYRPGKGSFSLRADSEFGLVVSHDRNTCGFDSLGNVTWCTEIAPFVQAGTVKKVNIATDKRTTVWGIRGTQYNVVTRIGSFNPVNLEVRLLVLNEYDEVTDSIQLVQRF